MATKESNKEKTKKTNNKNVKTLNKQKKTKSSANKSTKRKIANKKLAEIEKDNIKKEIKTKVILAIALVIALIISIIIIYVVSSKNDVEDKPQFFTSENEYVSGIDVSHHNGEIDWKTVAKNNDFVIIRTGYRGYTEGKIVEDTYFKENIKGAEKADIPIGVYFYSQATTVEEAREEASYVLSLIKGKDVSLPVFIDYEYAFNKDGMHDGRLFNANLTPAEATEIINAFCEKINKGGHYAGLYASSSILSNNIKTSKLNKNIYIWVADYNEYVKYQGDYDIWQYTKTGSSEGVSSRYTDLNYWYIK